MKPSELLREALESFGPEGERWHQGGMCDTPLLENASRWCALGAVLRRTPFLEGMGGYLSSSTATLTGSANVIDFNDDPSTTFEDVRLMFKWAIALAEADGQ